MNIDNNIKRIVKVLLVILGILLMVGVVFLANLIYRGTSKQKETEEFLEEIETELTREDFDNYNDYKDYLTYNETTIFETEGVLSGDKLLGDAVSHIKSTYKRLLSKKQGESYESKDIKVFTRKDEVLGLGKDFISEYSNVYLDSNLTVLGLVDDSVVVFGYNNYVETKELVCLDVNLETLNMFGVLYSVGEEYKSLKFNTGDCEYEEYKGFKILYIRG